MKAELIINHTAGGGKPQKIISEIISYFDTMNLKYHLSWTPSPGGATTLAQQAAEQGADLIISVGGDGTINEIINGIIPTQNQPALGIIPAGWANDFIKSTSIPKDIFQACQIIPKQKTKMIDIGLINEQMYFANVCGIGFDAEIAARANQMKINHPDWKTLSAYVYVFATIQKLLSPLSSFQAKITIDRQVLEGEMLFIAIANGRVEGGKFNITPDAEIDDGLLDICVVGKMNRFRSLYLLPKAIKGTHREVAEVSFFKGKEIMVEADREVTAQVAGEIIPAQNNYHIKILPKKLNLIVS
ncbi:MAG: diacylglycerol kinase family protein [Candidatus Caldatribacteriota bacterium]